MTSNLNYARKWLSDGPFWAHEPTEEEAGEVARSLAAQFGEVREECRPFLERMNVIAHSDASTLTLLNALANTWEELGEPLLAAIREAGK